MCVCVIFYKSTKTNQWKKYSLFNNGTGTNGYPYSKNKRSLIQTLLHIQNLTKNRSYAKYAK